MKNILCIIVFLVISLVTLAQNPQRDTTYKRNTTHHYKGFAFRLGCGLQKSFYTEFGLAYSHVGFGMGQAGGYSFYTSAG
jgi:hypothetical protein